MIQGWPEQEVPPHLSSPGRFCTASHLTPEEAETIHRLRLRAHP